MTHQTIEEVAGAIRRRELSSVEATEECLARIARHDARLRAFITVDAEGARAAAKRLDQDAAAGRWRGPLHGVPLAFKDLCHVPGLPTSCGTATREYFATPEACTAVARLEAAGAVTLGKLNMTELAMGPFGDNAHHGHVQNPWRAGHVAGGSSSGSGAAVSAGLALGRARQRHRRLHPAARGVLRHRGPEADLWAGEPGGGHGALVVERPHRPDDAHGARHRAHAGHHRRPRPARRHLEPARRARTTSRASRAGSPDCASAVPGELLLPGASPRDGGGRPAGGANARGARARASPRSGFPTRGRCSTCAT